MLAGLLRSSRPASAGYLQPSSQRGDLAGTVAVVTGGDSPLARAVALCLAHNGADVVLVYRREHDSAREAVRRMRSQGAGAIALCGALDDPSFSQRVAAAALAQLGHFDALPDAPAPSTRSAPRSEGAAVTGRAIADFGDALRERLAAHAVQVKAMTRGPIWSPLVPCDPDTEWPVNQHQGNAGPCFVYVARDDPARRAAQNPLRALSPPAAPPRRGGTRRRSP